MSEHVRPGLQRVPCKFPDCAATVRRYGTGWCAAHYHRVAKCADDDCANHISAHNRSGYCKEHSGLGIKLRRIARADALEAAQAGRMWAAPEKKGGRGVK